MNSLHPALEAGANAYAARLGQYSSLSRWECTVAGDLVGTLEMPLAVGLIGGATKVHPVARLALKILGVNSAEELARVIVAVGLAKKFRCSQGVGNHWNSEGTHGTACEEYCHDD